MAAESTKLLKPMRLNPKPKRRPEVKLPTLHEKIKLRQWPEARGHTLLLETPGTLEENSEGTRSDTGGRRVLERLGSPLWAS